MEIQVKNDAPAKVFAVPAVVNSWVLPWTPQELQEGQLADSELKSVLERLEGGKGRPPMSEIQGVGTRLQSLWALWNQLELSQGVLFRRWDDTNEATSRQLLSTGSDLVAEQQIQAIVSKIELNTEGLCTIEGRVLALTLPATVCNILSCIICKVALTEPLVPKCCNVVLVCKPCM